MRERCQLSPFPRLTFDVPPNAIKVQNRIAFLFPIDAGRSRVEREPAKGGNELVSEISSMARPGAPTCGGY